MNETGQMSIRRLVIGFQPVSFSSGDSRRPTTLSAAPRLTPCRGASTIQPYSCLCVKNTVFITKRGKGSLGFSLAGIIIYILFIIIQVSSPVASIVIVNTLYIIFHACFLL